MPAGSIRTWIRFDQAESTAPKQMVGSTHVKKSIKNLFKKTMRGIVFQSTLVSSTRYSIRTGKNVGQEEGYEPKQIETEETAKRTKKQRHHT